jgi:hypothetical protein
MTLCSICNVENVDRSCIRDIKLCENCCLKLPSFVSAHSYDLCCAYHFYVQSPHTQEKERIKQEKIVSKPFHCDILNCNSAFTLKYNLQRHYRENHHIYKRKKEIIEDDVEQQQSQPLVPAIPLIMDEEEEEEQMIFPVEVYSMDNNDGAIESDDGTKGEEMEMIKMEEPQDPFFCSLSPISSILSENDNIFFPPPYSLSPPITDDEYVQTHHSKELKEKDDAISILKQQLVQLKMDHASETQKYLQEILLLQARTTADQKRIDQLKDENLKLRCWKTHYTQFVRTG